MVAKAMHEPPLDAVVGEEEEDVRGKWYTYDELKDYHSRVSNAA